MILPLIQTHDLRPTGSSTKKKDRKGMVDVYANIGDVSSQHCLKSGSGCGCGSVPKSVVTFRMQKNLSFHIYYGNVLPVINEI
jgi:hypothetical protein